MSKVYVVSSDGSTHGMERIRCSDEDKELQRLLEKNSDLLPGDQIRPDDPRRWLLLKREMPVEDPGTGGYRWNIDFFFVDQSGTPTFVECKRFADTRSRREVVGQMLEYAANGHHYWGKDVILELLVEQSTQGNESLEEIIRKLEPDTGDSADDFIEHVENNLHEGQIRLVFFLEEAPYELRSVVKFLNKQMERTEVLIVEAKQYEKDGLRVVSPTVFGYTEQARRVKRATTIATTARKKWSEATFFEDAAKRLSDQDLICLRKLYDQLQSEEFELRWGTGKDTGSFSIAAPHLTHRSVAGVFSDGRMWFNFPYLSGTELLENAREEFARSLTEGLGLSLPADYSKRYPSVPVHAWAPKIDEFLVILCELVAKYGSTQTAWQNPGQHVQPRNLDPGDMNATHAL